MSICSKYPFRNHHHQSFLTNKKIPFDEVEASDPSNRALRDSLIAVARTPPIPDSSVVDHGGRAEYPLLFIMRSNRNIQFVGNWDRIQDILDAESISEDLLRKTPEVNTFDRFFRNMLCLVSFEQTLDNSSSAIVGRDSAWVSMCLFNSDCDTND